MEPKNNVLRMKELILRIQEADRAYFLEDAPIMTDHEYDALVEELRELEKTTGIVFANSPTKRVGGANKAELEKVQHTKPMLSAQKTKSVEEILDYFGNHHAVVSWKLDGLTLVLRYQNGRLVRAITRGEHGLVGEDVTRAAAHLRNVPKKVAIKENFEVRGEGVISWADYDLLNQGMDTGHPRNMAAGLVRTMTPDKGRLAHMDFWAFELIMPEDTSKTKAEQLDLLQANGFSVVGHTLTKGGREALKECIESFRPDEFPYPVDGLIIEFNDLAYGRSRGRTEHHENRMYALKWDDELYMTTFRRVTISSTRNGMITLAAEFDPVVIDGTRVERADLHSLSGFEKLCLGEGDTIQVYKADMIIPQIAANLTRSGTYKLPERCPACGAKLEIRVSSAGIRSLWCPNDDCIAKNAQKIARFCDKDAMNLEGFTAANIENLLAYGVLSNYADLYKMEMKRERIISIPGIGYGTFDRMIASVEESRRCHLYQFLVAVGIPKLGPAQARSLDEYFLGSWDDFEKAVKDGFAFSHIEGVTPAVEKSIYKWYSDEHEEKLWRPVLREISFIGNPKEIGESGNPFRNANVAVTGAVNGMNRKDLQELLTLLGAEVTEAVNKNTTYLIVGAEPGTEKLAAALSMGVKIITEGHFAKMLAGTEVK